MLQISITSDDSERVIASFNNIALGLTETRGLLNEIGVQATRDMIKNFDREEDSFGSRWIPSQRAIREKGKTLQDTGKLRSIEHEVVSNDMVTIGTRMPYGIYHQKGTSRLPIREWAYLNQQAIQNIVRLTVLYLRGLLKK